MEIYRIGKVVTIGKTYIIFESRYRGEIIYVANPQSFTLSKIQKIYIFKYKNNDHIILYGFFSFRERSLFVNLLNIHSIGNKMALNLLKINFEIVIEWIINQRFDKIAKLPLWNHKVAKKIVWELSEKYRHWYKELLTLNVNNDQQNQQTLLVHENDQKNSNSFNNN